MSNSLRDALLRAGVTPAEKSGERRKRKPRPPAASKPAKPDEEEIELARAWALRARSDAEEERRRREEAERRTREKKERRQRLQALLDGRSLLREDADRVRHYEFRGKIRRVHVTADQLAALNAGELGVVQQGSRFLLVPAELARAAREIDPDCLALLVDPAAADSGDDGVPDDLTW